jgi:hypothetical protein
MSHVGAVWLGSERWENYPHRESTAQALRVRDSKLPFHQNLLRIGPALSSGLHDRRHNDENVHERRFTDPCLSRYEDHLALSLQCCC